VSKLTPFAAHNFRVSQISAGYAKETAVKRMNRLASVLKHAKQIPQAIRSVSTKNSTL